MKRIVRPCWWRVIVALCGFSLVTFSTFAQSFNLTGTNQPGTAQNFPFTLIPGTTNLGISITGNGTAFSHLQLKRGAVAPTDLDYDFIAAQDGSSNAINLEVP